MKTVLFLTFLFSLISTLTLGQIPTPNNGVKKSEASAYVLRNAKIIVGPDQIIKKGSLVVQEGKFKAVGRSEEHTSELQSRPHLVCRLLLENRIAITLK